MMIPALLARHARLAGIGALSLLLHLLAIALINPQVAPPATRGSPALSVRLTQVASVAQQPQAPLQADGFSQLGGASESGSAAPDSAALAPDPVPDPAPAPAQAAASTRARSTAPTMSADTQAGIVIDSPPDQTIRRTPGQDGDARAVRMPGRYRVAPPPSARLSYTVRASSPDGATAAGGQAQLTWTNEGTRYGLQMNGVLGERRSEGDVDDAGVAPLRAVEPLGAGSATTRFERDAGQIVAGGANTAHRLLQGSQDLASLLLQLSGMGLADAAQMKGILEFWVGGAEGARIERFEVLGREPLATGAGTLATVHLARLNDPDAVDAPRLEIWLAPQHAWLPVQLRLSRLDGAAQTQTLATIEIAPVPQF